MVLGSIGMGCLLAAVSLPDAGPPASFAGADPFIFRAGDAWWLITSHDAPGGRHLPMHRSTDLEYWRLMGGAVAPGDSPKAWNRRNFWAPEVVCRDGRYLCYYTAMPDGTPGNEGNRVGLAVASRPEGPYEDVGVVIPHASIDGSPAFDFMGGDWLLFTAEFGNSQGQRPGVIALHRLVDDRTVDAMPTILMDTHAWQEGGFFLPMPDGRVALVFSTGAWTDRTYCLRWSIGPGPAGPFVEQPDVLLQTGEDLFGPGHANRFPGPNGEPWLVFHSWDREHTRRQPHVAPLSWEMGRLRVGKPRIARVAP